MAANGAGHDEWEEPGLLTRFVGSSVDDPLLPAVWLTRSGVEKVWGYSYDDEPGGTMKVVCNVLAIGSVLSVCAGAVFAQVTPVGPEFQVNTYTTNYQGLPKVCRAQEGNFTVVWRSEGQDGSLSGIFGQRYDSAGGALGNEFQINTFTANAQARPVLACNSTGDFVVAWRSSGQDGDGDGIFAQRYASGGAALGTEFQVNAYTTGSQDHPGVSADADGNFVVVWTSPGQDGDGSGVFAQRYDSNGAALGTEFQVNTFTTGSQTTALGSPVSSDSNFNFVVAWRSDGQDGDLRGVFAQRYDSNGVAQGTEFQVNSYTTGSQDSPAVTRAAGGDFVVAWRSSGQDGSGYGIFGQRYSSAGAAAGTEFQVNTYTTGGQAFPAVATNVAGDFVVAWASDGQDGDSSGVFAQRFDRTATPVGTEFQVNTYTTGFQSLESVSSDAMGNFVVTWISPHDGDGFGVFAQRFAAPCPPLPRTDCLSGGTLRSTLVMKESPYDYARKLTWKWARGAQTDLADFGDPLTATSYALCVYDQVGGVASVATSFEVSPDSLGSLCAAPPCWTSKGDRGFRYKDSTGGAQGIKVAVLKPGADGKAKIVVRGGGAALPLPVPTATEFLNQDTAVTVQLVNGVGKCWTANFVQPALKNDPQKFRDKQG